MEEKSQRYFEILKESNTGWPDLTNASGGALDFRQGIVFEYEHLPSISWGDESYLLFI